jgi:hemoglobin
LYIDKIPTLYEWAGGNAVFEKLTKAFYDKVRTMTTAGTQMVAHHVGKMLDEPKRKRWIQLFRYGR